MRLHRPLPATLAALLAACVLLLGLAAFSPEVHESICLEESHLHTDHAKSKAHSSTAADADHEDHGCAVHLFAHGCTSAVPAVFVSPPVLNATNVAHFTEFLLARSLRGPARVCGPPALV